MTSEVVRPGSIVVGVDGSEHAARAVAWAAAQASLERRPLALVHCARSASGAGLLADAVRQASLAAADLDVVAVQATDDPRDTLIDLSTDAHLLVLGSRGRGAVRSSVLGSVSASVSRGAACPVVVCRPPQGPVEDRILVGADGTRESLPVLEFAFAQASMRGLPLTVMHCFYDAAVVSTGPGVVPADDPEDLGDLHLLLAESVAGLGEKYPDVHVTRQLARGLVDICLAGHPPEAALVVVGSTPASGWSRFAHASCALAVLERTHTTVAVVPELS